jgi:hypothetical protein
MNRQQLIDKGKIWQIYHDGKPDTILCEGNKTKCQNFLRINSLLGEYKKGRIRLAKLIYEPAI